MKIKNILKVQGEAGFTLVEVMIAAVIGMIVVLGLSSIVVQAVRYDASAKVQRNYYTTQQQADYEKTVLAAPTP